MTIREVLTSQHMQDAVRLAENGKTNFQEWWQAVSYHECAKSHDDRDDYKKMLFHCTSPIVHTRLTKKKLWQAGYCKNVVKGFMLS